MRFREVEKNIEKEVLIKKERDEFKKIKPTINNTNVNEAKAFWDVMFLTGEES